MPSPLRIALIPLALLAMSGPALADRSIIEIGAHKTADNKDYADTLAKMFQQVLNTLPDQIEGGVDIKDFLKPYYAAPAEVGDSTEAMKTEWQQHPETLMLLAGYLADGVFSDTVYVGTANAVFHLETALVQILNTAEFPENTDLAHVVTYYALIRDGQDRKIDRTVLNALISYTIEQAESVNTLYAGKPAAKYAQKIEKDLKPLLAANGAVQP